MDAVGQKEVEGERDVLRVPGSRHVYVVLGVDPLRVNLEAQRKVGSEE